jgi:outer membrane receptor for ferrienterochelin and colicin
MIVTVLIRIPRTVVLAVVLTGTIVGHLEAQLQQGTISVVVLSDQGLAVKDVTVLLTDPLGAELQRRVADASGRVVFADVAPGRYEVRTSIGSAEPLQLPVEVVAALPLELIIRIPMTVTDRVVVEGTAPDEPSTRGSLGGESISRMPTRVRSRALQDVVATLPGWSTEDNGLLHARGVDDGFLYVIDGVPVYERLDAVSGLAPDLTSVSSVNVVTGYVPPEFGYKAGGVIEVRSAAATTWTGTVDIAGGSDAMREGAVALGGRLGDHTTLRAGLASMASDRFLDPVHPDNLHNSGGQSHTFGQVEWSAARDRVSAGWGYGRSSFDVPNNEDQEEAGQQQRQQIGQTSFNTTWQRTWSLNVVTQGAAYFRRTTSRLDGSRHDTPLEAHADRALARTGVLFAVTRQHGQHLLKAGVEWQQLAMDEYFTFAITDEDEAREAGFRDEALQFTPDNPFLFNGTARPTLFSAYVQDSWHVLARLTLSGGVRFDSSELLLPRTQWSPRAGAALRLSETTLVRGAVSRFFQPPQPENLLLSSSPEARVLSSIIVGEDEGGADIEPERQWGTEIGVEQRIGRARLDVTYWARGMENVADPNVFAGTTIIFPNAVAEGRAQGVEMRVQLPKQRGWSGYANWAVAKVVQTGPINGGLFLEDEVEEIGPGVEFTPDHDQRFAAGGGVTWEHTGSGAAVSLTARYETGTPVQQDDDDLDELLDRPGAEMVDFEAGRVNPRTVVSLLLTAPFFRGANVTASAGVQLLNLFDARYAYNFGNPFSGTHFGAPRTFAVNLRLRFR